MRQISLLLIIIVLFSGCARALVGDKTPVEKVYYRSQGVQLPKIKEIKVLPYTGYQKSFYPVINPPVVKRVWILPFQTETGALVGGFWMCIIVKEPSWYIETYERKTRIKPVVIPYKEEK